MPSFKRVLLFFSIGMFLFAGLLFTSSTSVASPAFANGCNSVAKGSWSNNCQISEGNMSFFPTTFAGVECFQRAKHIVADGILSPLTWEALQNTLICTLINNVTEGCHLPA